MGRSGSQVRRQSMHVCLRDDAHVAGRGRMWREGGEEWSGQADWSCSTIPMAPWALRVYFVSKQRADV